MRIVVLAVGKDRQGPTFELFETYRKRCSWRIDLIDIPQRSHGDKTRRLRDEAEKIRKNLQDNTAIVVLDERGEDLSSPALAARIDGFRHAGHPSLTFIIGGADGLDPDLSARADLRLAFGQAVWPHRLVRVMLAEQLYRASAILAGHPYHRD